MASSVQIDGIPAKFCEVVIHPEVDYLKIQQDFAINYGYNLPSRVLLKVPLTDKTFEVEVVKSDGEILLKKGWEVFKEQNSIKYGDFLMFEFDGVSTFDVYVFDRTCTHRECPFDDEETGSDSDEGFEIVPNSEWERIASVARDEGESSRQRSKTNIGRVNRDSDDSESSEDDDTLEDGLGIGLCHTIIRKVKIYEAHRFKLPLQFVKDTGLSAYSKIILKNVKGDQQEVNLVGGVRDRHAFGAGWYDFLITNRVTIGSTLSFKFVSSAIIEVRVEKMATDKRTLFEYVKKRYGRHTIILAGNHTNKGKGTVTNEEGGSRMRTKPVNISNSQELSTGLSESSGYTWEFSKIMKDHHVNKLDIPKRFVNGTGLATEDEITLKVKYGGAWPVGVSHDKKNRYYITTGWRDFLRDNRVFEGNKITFKFVRDSDYWIEARVWKNGAMGSPLFSLNGLGRPPSSNL